MPATLFCPSVFQLWRRSCKFAGIWRVGLSAKRPARGARFRLGTIESLECRALLSASLAGEQQMFPQINVAPQGVTSAARSSPYGLSPDQVRAAYGFDRITFGGGIVGDGSGQTVAIIDAYDAPNIANDLAVFDQTYGLPAPPSFRKAVQSDDAGNPPDYDEGWTQEISLDVEWAHAMAPRANILLVEANTSYTDDLETVVDWARQQPGVSVVSMSYGSHDSGWEISEDSFYTTPAGHAGVSFVAASGDDSAPIYPALSPNVLGVGGTRLTVSAQGYGGETAWSSGGGGLSAYEPEPDYQLSVQQTGSRSAPDVAYDADPRTGFSVYDSSSGGWLKIGGTSAGAPQWAAMLAIVNQGRQLAGESPLNGANQAVYALPSRDFHDITSGSNGNDAGPGYDLVTGRGSPIADAIVHDLIGPAGSIPSTPPSAPPTTQPTPAAPTLPADEAMMYRVYNPQAATHHFTTSLYEFQTLVSEGWVDETTGHNGFAISSTSATGTAPLHRLYNANNGQHYLTASDGEVAALLDAGWHYEQDEGYVYTAAAQGTAEIYNLYNRVTGEHLYSTDSAEVDAITHQFPGIWEKQTSLGFGFVVPESATAPRAAADQAVTTVAEMGSQMSDGSGIGADRLGQNSTKTAAPTYALAGAQPTTLPLQKEELEGVASALSPRSAMNNQPSQSPSSTETAGSPAALDIAWVEFARQVGTTADA